MTNQYLHVAAFAFAAVVTNNSVMAQDKAQTPTPEKAPPHANAKAAEAKPAAGGAGSKPFENYLKEKGAPDAITRGKFNLNVRPRWEHAHQTGVEESDAFTVRTRLGYTTANFSGFQGMVEGENVSVIGPRHNFNAAGSNGEPGRTIVADPDTTELNQAWLSYTNWSTMAKVGRQRIALDNHRFIGDVGWRQNMQTFDAALLENKSLPYTTLLYGYIWDVHRVFGDVSGLPAGNRDFDSHSHIFRYTYDHWKFLKINAYTFLLDLRQHRVANDPLSSATYGGFLNGTIPAHEKVSLDYRAEFAWQTDYADYAVVGPKGAGYSTEYYNLELGATIKPVNFGIGYEVLGSDNGKGFSTPLATLHAFNGWADVFLTTPGTGLRDAYAFTGITLPYEVPLRFVFHDYRSVDGGFHYGREYNAVVSKKIGKYWTVLAKYAYYDGQDGPTPLLNGDVDKFWLQAEFNY